MKSTRHMLLLAIPILLVSTITPVAQQKQSGPKKPGMKMDMSSMMQSAHHQLMMAYMESMTAFASSIRKQATKSMEVEAARATVAELRHNLDAMEALHQKHMQSMSADMQAKMQTMMQEMDKDRAMLKDQVSALESDLQTDKPDTAQVTAHANALVKHLAMMTRMHSGSKAGQKKTTGMKMKM